MKNYILGMGINVFFILRFQKSSFFFIFISDCSAVRESSQRHNNQTWKCCHSNVIYLCFKKHIRCYRNRSIDL